MAVCVYGNKKWFPNFTHIAFLTVIPHTHSLSLSISLYFFASYTNFVALDEEKGMRIRIIYTKGINPSKNVFSSFEKKKKVEKGNNNIRRSRTFYGFYYDSK